MMRSLSRGQAQRLMLGQLGLTVDLSITRPEVIAAATRRAAGFLCPCLPETIADSVAVAFDGLVDDAVALRAEINDMIERLIIHGDLIEDSHTGENTSRRGCLVYTAPPSFVWRGSSAILLGVVPDRVSALPHDLEARIEYDEHVRRLKADSHSDLRARLLEQRLVELADDEWLRPPPTEPPETHISRMEERLQGAPPSGGIDGLAVLDANTSIETYTERWGEPDHLTGRFVARRPVAFGAPRWCFVELRVGTPVRFLDLPLLGSTNRGCDEGWHLQAAIDANRKQPQRFRRQAVEEAVTFRLHMPPPLWLERRWRALGARRESAFAFQLGYEHVQQEVQFLREKLWMTEAPQ